MRQRVRRRSLLTRRAPGLVMAALLGATAALATLPATAFAATTLNVPGTYATIQAAIVAAADGDTVLVAPGTYDERIDFLHKNITVQSSSRSCRDDHRRRRRGRGREDGDRPVRDADRSAASRSGTAAAAARTTAASTSPAVPRSSRTISSRATCSATAAASRSTSRPRRSADNVITNNRQTSCSGGSGGGGMSISGAGTVQLIGNIIDGNRDGSWAGGMYALRRAGRH